MHGLMMDWLRLPYICLVAVTMALFSLLVYAHEGFQPKSHEFRGGGHEIQVKLVHENVLTVSIDGEEIGGRADFCQPR